MKKITILGSTGSIGSNSLDIIQKHQEQFKVGVLTANSNYKKLAMLANLFNPDVIAIGNKKFYPELKKLLSSKKTKIIAGEEGIIEAASYKSDIAISAIVGIAALKPTMKLIENTYILGLANKESIVCGGTIITDHAKKNNVTLIPIDSEHNSIFRIFDFNNINEISKITLSASGGPFLNKSISDLKDVTPEEAVKHPNWSMGHKISIDSATMVNKALEIIEAYYLFPVRSDMIDVIIHPESIIHALVHYIDGSVKAVLSEPDMKTPISYALTYPNKIDMNMNLNLANIKTLNFIKPDLEKFKALKIVKDLLKQKNNKPIIFNASNEVLVENFLQRKIKFLDIVNNIERVLDKFANENIENLEHVFDIDFQAREITKQLIN